MIHNGVEMSMDKICRSCMTETPEAKNVFENCMIDQTFLIADVLMACASVVVNVEDGLPKRICSICEDKLSVAYLFKQQCEKADNTLRELTNQQRREDIEVKPDVDIDDFYNDADNVSTDSEIQYTPKTKSSKVHLKCDFCNKNFRSKNGYQLHMKRHTKEPLLTCHICNKKFTKALLFKHLQTDHEVNVEGDNFPCTHCELRFHTLSSLDTHMKEHRKQNDGCIKQECDDDDEDETEIKNECDLDDVKPDEDGKYSCKHCAKVLANLEDLKVHLRRHTGISLFSCKICNKAYEKSNHLKRHMSSHKKKLKLTSVKHESRDRKVMQCEFCDRKFKYKKSFTHHMQTEHGISDDSDTPLSILVAKNERKSSTRGGLRDKEETESADSDLGNLDETDNLDPNQEDGSINSKPRKVHMCHVCNAKFVRSNHLTRHMTLHRNVLIHKCERCDKAFASEEFLSKHMKEDHIDKPYTCTVCNKTYTRGEHLIRHLKIHLNPLELDIKCSVCERVFQRSDHLARHIKLHLQQDKRHICNECGKAFNRLDNLRAHQRIHSGQRDNAKLHLCIYCGKEFNNSSNMIVHMRRHTGERPYKCDQCGKGFPRSHDLKCHERTHSGEKPYKCTMCSKAFNKSNKLLRHTRVHTGERPYVCNLCGRAFTQSNDLALHMRRHTGSRPYACGVCPARFIQSGQLKAHKRSTGHWKEIPPDLKGGHRVEPVAPVGEPAPIRFKTHGKKRSLEEEELLAEGVGPMIVHNPVVAPIIAENVYVQIQDGQQIGQEQQITMSNVSITYEDGGVGVIGGDMGMKEEVQSYKAEPGVAPLKPENNGTFQTYASDVQTPTTYTNSFTYQSY
ncbi:zinc finger protein 271-like [Onthophagus taurus]|uniref:zinc finger protein 271-like n=1 Tax=Onthophagus taurus TaxID=166361 RepID=UPI000C2090E2|nr:zinc finger protein 271-like [Onthophagus taurus]